MRLLPIGDKERCFRCRFIVSIFFSGDELRTEERPEPHSERHPEEHSEILRKRRLFRPRIDGEHMNVFPFLGEQLKERVNNLNFFIYFS